MTIDITTKMHVMFLPHRSCSLHILPGHHNNLHLFGSVFLQKKELMSISRLMFYVHCALVAGAWTERKKMYHGGSFLKLADDNVDI